MIPGHIVFPCGGIQLEGVLSLPGGKGPFPCVVVCHPHPLYGGDMDNNVVTAVCSALVKSSIAALRFNFRLPDSIAGNEHSREKDGQDDLLAALDFLAALKEIDNTKIGLAGYSFGGMVASAVAVQDNRVQQLALISPSLDMAGWIQLQKYNRPKIILTGAEDTTVPFRPFQRLIEDLRPYQIIPGADHFWSGFEERISGKIALFFHDGFMGQ